MGASIIITAAMIRACEVTWQWWDVIARVTRGTSLVVKKKTFLGFPVSVNNSITEGPLLFLLLQMFVITDNIMKFPVNTNGS
jgi:hypothetical protein